MTTTAFPKGIEVVCGAIVEDADGRILLMQGQKWRNKWSVPGGHVEAGETVEQCCVREVREETGLTVQPVAIVRWGESINSQDFHRPSHIVFADIHCRTAATDVRTDPVEHSAYQWVAPEETRGMVLAENSRNAVDAFIVYRRQRSPHP